jgi:hypothetical protein
MASDLAYDGLRAAVSLSSAYQQVREKWLFPVFGI